MATPLHLRWQHIIPGNYVVEVCTMDGAVIQSHNISVGKTNDETIMELSEIVAGNYFLRLLNTKSKKQLVQQLLIQE